MGQTPPLPRLIVVCLHKAGTHLALRLIEELGFHRRYFEDDMLECVERDPAETFLGKMEPGAAYFLHECRLDRFPRHLFDHWREHGDPVFIYQYRDPRAVLLSEVNYLRRQHRGSSFSNTTYHLAFSDALCAQANQGDALDIALHCMGDYLTESFLGSVWMLHHPEVHRVTYESLVGERGGGTDVEQVAEVARLIRRLGLSADETKVASRLFDSGQRTFHRGQVDAWREIYAPRQLRLFESRYGHILDAYGYHREAGPGPAG